jgi:hypothetical protein
MEFIIVQYGFEEDAHADGIDEEKHHPGNSDHIPAIENTGLYGQG